MKTTNFPRIRLLFILMLIGIAYPSCLPAATYYVATNGNDARSIAQAQNISTPWKTIQKAATNMAAGDTCQIRAGTYRETVTVPVSGSPAAPITFRAYGSEVVTISGADPISGWTRESANIYYAPMSWTLGDGDQVFQNGAMKPPARWPNAGATYPWENSLLAHPSPYNQLGTWSYVDAAGYTGGSNGWLTDAQLPSRSDGYWNGATVHIMGGYGWIMQHPVVTGYNANTKTLTITNANYTDAAYAIAAGNEYYLTGKKGEMDSAGEWFYDSALSRLYFYSTATPANVQAKKRNYGFSFKGKSYINLINLDFFACTIETDENSTYATFDGLFMKFTGHSQQDASSYGLVLRNGCVLRNSELAWDSRGLIQLAGSDIRMINNTLHDSGYVPTWTAMVDAGINTPAALAYQRNLISHNTLHDAGRPIMGFPGRASIFEYNDLYNGMKLTTDGGIFYANLDAGNSIIRYNLIHDSSGPAGHAGAPIIGLYLDNQNNNWIVHHNIIWNLPDFAMLNNARLNSNMIFNNTCWTTGGGFISPTPWTDGETGTNIYNNIFKGPPSGDRITLGLIDFRYNLYTDPGFIAPATGDFRLQSTAVAINAGTVIPGVTDGCIGTPDLGALEYGAPDWRTSVGYKTTPPSPDPVYVLPDMIFANKVKDGSFENGSLAPNWTVTGNVSMQSGHSWNDTFIRTGGYSVKFGSGTSEISQVVTGLQPGKRYMFYAGVQNATGDNVVNVGVRDGSAVFQTAAVSAVIDDWHINNLSFITGPTSTSVEVYVNATISDGSTTPVYVDDLSVELSHSIPVIPGRSPILHYAFNESSGTTAFDGSVYGRDGTVYATTPDWEAGVFGNCLNFNGMNEYVLTPAITTPDAITVACWAKSNTATWNDLGVLVSQPGVFALYPSAGEKLVWFYVWCGGQYYPARFYPSSDFDITAWHHYAGVYFPEKSQLLIYVDGILSGSTSLSDPMDISTSPIQIGRWCDSHYLNGQVDDVRIYDYELDESEIRALQTQDTSKILHLSFDESPGATTAWDSSGNGKNGVLSNTMTSVPGVLNGAMSFNGVNDYVLTPAIPTPEEITVACWAKSNTATWNDLGVLVSQPGSFVLYPSKDEKLVWFYVVSGGQYYPARFYPSSDFDITAWHHYAGVYSPSAGQILIYVDGILSGSTPLSSAMDTSNAPIQIGRWCDSHYLNGQVDDVRIYSRALPWNEVLELSKQTNAPPYE